MEIKRGGKRYGAGRKKGVRDKATGEQRASLAELARTHDKAAIAVLVHVMKTGESEAARVSAANSILDRGYGRPHQSVEATVEVNKHAGFAAVADALDGDVFTATGRPDGTGDLEEDGAA